MKAELDRLETATRSAFRQAECALAVRKAAIVLLRQADVPMPFDQTEADSP